MDKLAQSEVRLLREEDIPAAMRLKELARWNQTEADWRRLLRLEPHGCFCVTADGQVIGTTTTTTYGRELAWIGMMLVDPRYRHRGVATTLMRVALNYLSEMKIDAVKLDATAEGRPLYEKLGFRVESLIERWAGMAQDSFAMNHSTFNSAEGPELFALDRRAVGVDRSKLIEMLIQDGCVPPVLSRGSDGRLNAYGLARKGSEATYVGPLVANDHDSATTQFDQLLNLLAGQPIYVDVNTTFPSGRELVSARGLIKQRHLIRMRFGEQSNAGSSASVFAIAGPEFG